MDDSYKQLENDRDTTVQHPPSEDEKRYEYHIFAFVQIAYTLSSINTTLRYAIYGSALLLIIIASVGFWAASRNQPLFFSLGATQAVENHAKSMTFVWTLIGTILAFSTGTLFNQLLKVSMQQRVAAHGLKIGLIEFWSRLYSRKWLHDHRSGRLILSIFSVIFAIAVGLLVSVSLRFMRPSSCVC